MVMVRNKSNFVSSLLSESRRVKLCQISWWDWSWNDWKVHLRCLEGICTCSGSWYCQFGSFQVEQHSSQLKLSERRCEMVHIGKCTKYFIDMHYQCGRLFQMYNWWNTLGTFSAFLTFVIVVKDYRCFIEAPIFYPSEFSICISCCSGSVRSAILIATTKEGNILISKCFLNHNDHHCLHHHGHPHNQHDNAQLTGSEQHNPPLYLPGLGSRLPHKLAEGFSSSSPPTWPLFELFFHVVTKVLDKV